MTAFHRYVGYAVVAAFVVLAVYGLVARVRKRDSLGRSFWGLLYYTETVLVIQVVVGLVLFFIGRRVPNVRHYFYGSLFPLVALVAGRIASLRRDRRDYVPIALAALVCFGLTLMALLTGLGVL